MSGYLAIYIIYLLFQYLNLFSIKNDFCYFLIILIIIYIVNIRENTNLNILECEKFSQLDIFVNDTDVISILFY